MRVARSDHADSTIQALSKKYRSLSKDIEYFERLLSRGGLPPPIPYGSIDCTREGVPAQIFKSYVLVPQLGGKKNGMRYVFERLKVDGVEWAWCICAYTHHEDAKEPQIRRTIRRLHADTEITVGYLLARETTPSD